MGAKDLAPSGFDPWTVQPVVSRYTDRCGNTVAAEFVGVATDADVSTSNAGRNTGHVYTLLHREYVTGDTFRAHLAVCCNSCLV